MFPTDNHQATGALQRLAEAIPSNLHVRLADGSSYFQLVCLPRSLVAVVERNGAGC